MFPLKISNVPISQFHAKLSNLRVKIKRVVLNIDVHERIRKKGIRTFFFLKDLDTLQCITIPIRLISSYNYTVIPFNERVALPDYLS